MLRMCVCTHSRFVENHPIRILEDGPVISKVVLSQGGHSPSKWDGLRPAPHHAEQLDRAAHF
jgi:hypothetical protein